MRTHQAENPWALVLAGGDGKRLESLTSAIYGRAIPKQYCPLLEGRSLLEMTLSRIRPAFHPRRTLAVINERHRELAEPQISSLPATNVLAHRKNLDTGPGITSCLLELFARDPDATVAVFPSDHWVGDELRFQSEIARLLALVATEPDRIALLGARPETPDTGLGYIVPGARLGDAGTSFQVRSFCEKPNASLALRLVTAHGALWNTFIMAFRVRRALELLAAIRPGVLSPPHTDVLEEGTGREPGSVAWSFSSGFLAPAVGHLSVLAARDFGWSDWGTPETIRRTLASQALPAPWLAEPAARACFA